MVLGFPAVKSPTTIPAPAPKRNFNHTLDLAKIQTIANVIVADEEPPAHAVREQVENLMLIGTFMAGARPSAVVEDEAGRKTRTFFIAGLALLAWNRGGDDTIDEAEVFALYERNWRYVDEANLSQTERQFLADLVPWFGTGFCMFKRPGYHRVAEVLGALNPD